MVDKPYMDDYQEGRSGAAEAMIFGVHPILEALEAGKEIEKIFIQRDGKAEPIRALLDKAKEQHVPVMRVPIEKLNRFTRKNHQGVIAFLSAIRYGNLDNIIADVFSRGGMPLILILDRITDVRNFGAIARSASCLGVDAIVVPAKGQALITGDAVKTSAGALNHLPICREQDLRKTVKYLKECGLSVLAVTEKGSDRPDKVDCNVPLALILGSEEDGIQNELLRDADHLARIDMVGPIASLNVSVAAGVLLYEVSRQRSH